MPKILIAGDFVPRYRVASLIDNKDYQTVLGEVKPLTGEADFSIVNLEAPVIYGEPTPITKTGPNLSCNENAVEALRWAGFDCVTLANNHFYDQGEQGVEGTLKACEKYGMLHVGGGHNLNDAKQILYKEIDGKRFAIINCCEREFSIAGKKHGGSNPQDPIQQYYDIQDARKQADYVIVIVHGGIEMFQYPTIEMKKTYRFYIDAGADVVVNHHQHCFSGFEIYHDSPIFYGLGNFCFDKLNISIDEIWEEGYMVMLELGEKISSIIHPYKQCGISNENVKMLDEKDSFNTRLSVINKRIADDDLLSKEYDSLVIRTRERYIMELLNYDHRILRALYRRNLFPSFLSRRMLIRLLGDLRCTSNLMRLEEAISHKLNI